MLYKIRLTPLTPIHIGTGATIEPYEYVITDRLYKFRPELFIANLQKNDQERFLKLASQDVLVMREFVRNRFRGSSAGLEYAIDVHPEALRIYEERLKNIRSDLSVSPCIKSSGMPYIPGSSLKGAIRTALLYDRVQKPVHEFDVRKLEAEAFGYDLRRYNGRFLKADMTQDPFKFLKIGDSKKKEGSTRLEAISVHTNRGGKWSEEMTLLREVTYSVFTSTGHLPEFEFSLATKENPVTGKSPFPVNQLIDDCNAFYYLHLRHEKEFLGSFSQARTWYEGLEKVYEKLPDNSCLIRLGWGTGFDGITINYAREPRERKRSRRLTADFVPLGWATLTFYRE